MRTFVVSSSTQDPITCTLRQALAPLIGNQVPSHVPFAAVDKIPSQAAELVIVVLPLNPEKGLEAIRDLRREFTGRLLAVGKASEPKVILRALQSGADHYLDQEELESDLEAALARLLNKHDTGSAGGRLLGVLSVSGGCGASTLAVNISAALARDHRRCCLVDLNPGRGDLYTLLNLKPQFTLADLCLNQARLDRAMFEKTLAPHPSGVHLLASPTQFADARVINPEGISQALSLARKAFEHVVVDLEDCFHDEQVAAMHQATGLLLVCRLDFTALRNARRVLDHLAKLDIGRSRVRLIVNQFGEPNELPIDEAEDALHEKLSYFVPHDPKVINAANNTGIPAVLKEPASKVAQGLAQLATIEFDKRPASSASLPKIFDLPRNFLRPSGTHG